ncbi:DsbA family protein [Corynebacterium argentoratense]|jgi:hypothetical protein|uniref:DsbA family protein n=1 Tax=Corynebacterium argentoratense TaxID=42817 RepID=UPI0024319011|nr:thioredoxin domain-containing protein [Corynebacterium argentoratense]
MSTKVKNPNEKSYGFIIALLVIIVLGLGVISYIVISGNKAQTEQREASMVAVDNLEVSYKDNAITLKSPAATADTPQVDLYEDYSCPHCAELAEAADADMLKAIEEGKLVVHVRTLNFMDQGTEANSTRAGAAALAIAKSGDAQGYWNYRAMLMRDQNMLRTSDWDNAKYGDAAVDYNVPDDVVKDIKDGADVDAMKDFANASADSLKAAIGKVSSPHILYDGKDLDLRDGTGWIKEVTN